MLALCWHNMLTYYTLYFASIIDVGLILIPIIPQIETLYNYYQPLPYVHDCLDTLLDVWLNTYAILHMLIMPQNTSCSSHLLLDIKIFGYGFKFT